MTDTRKQDLSYAGEMVRRYDNDRYICALFAPTDRRETLFALYAFNLEIARTREAVSDPMVGEIRLQWWRETLDGVFAGNPREHPVAEALSAAVLRHDLSRRHLDTLIDAREFDLEDRPPWDLSELRQYARSSSAALLALALEALGASNETALEAADQVGVAWALVGLLRAARFHATGKRVYLPQDRLAAAEVNMNDFLELRPSGAVARVAREVADAAREHLAAARQLRRDVPRTALPALLPATLAGHWLRLLEKAEYDLFDPRLDRRGGAGRLIQVARAAWTGRY